MKLHSTAFAKSRVGPPLSATRACKSPRSEQGAREGAPFIARHIIETAERAFDDFAASGADDEANRRMLGLAAKKASNKDAR